jgi:hypothetical protein
MPNITVTLDQIIDNDSRRAHRKAAIRSALSPQKQEKIFKKP